MRGSCLKEVRRSVGEVERQEKAACQRPGVLVLMVITSARVLMMAEGHVEGVWEQVCVQEIDRVVLENPP
jgi:hypothetical protein